MKSVYRECLFMNVRLVALGVCLAATVVSAQAQVHRWVGERGVVQYGDRPPASGATVLRVRAESATAPVSRTAAPDAPAAAASARRPAGPAGAAPGATRARASVPPA
jgi:hypothetical protein